MSNERLPEFPEYEPRPEWHAVTSIQLGELVEAGFLDWAEASWDWSAYAYDADQYERICTMFLERYWWREIGIVPPGEWKQRLLYKLKYELMPKYKLLYKQLESGIDVLSAGGEYHKKRDISSTFPETALGGSTGNEVYASTGTDTEYETVKALPTIDGLEAFKNRFRNIDTMLLDELEGLFSGLWSVSMSGY